MDIKTKNKKIVVAICGASGSIYGIRLLKALLSIPIEVHLIISKTGYTVLEHEAGFTNGSFLSFLKQKGVKFYNQDFLNIHNQDNFFAPPASGSFRHDGMIVVPCSMKTLGAVASGISDNLIHRAADVALKEKRSLILVIRETPLSVIHLNNMRKTAIAGATIMPASPSFYFHPKTVFDVVDSVVARILDHLKIDQNLFEQWGTHYSK